MATASSTEPDELYTLRAQYWLGHYQMAIDEAKATSRRPMSAALKAEREEFLARSQIALGHYDRVTSKDTPALEALAIKAIYDKNVGNEAAQTQAVNDMKSLLGLNSGDTSVQLTASHVLLAAGQTKEALQCVHAAGTMEHAATAVQIYLKLDRLDLAREQYQQLKHQDEDAVLTQLSFVLLQLAQGSSGGADAVHALNSLQEQYGPSTLLLNYMAAAHMQRGDYPAAEARLKECFNEHVETAVPDTLVNMIACCTQQNKSPADYVQRMKQDYPTHPFCAALDRVQTAFDREALKYKV